MQGLVHPGRLAARGGGALGAEEVAEVVRLAAALDLNKN